MGSGTRCLVWVVWPWANCLTSLCFHTLPTCPGLCPAADPTAHPLRVVITKPRKHPKTQILSLAPSILREERVCSALFLWCPLLSSHRRQRWSVWFLGAIVKPSQNSISPWLFDLLFFYLNVPWSFSEGKTDSYQIAYKIKETWVLL